MKLIKLCAIFILALSVTTNTFSQSEAKKDLQIVELKSFRLSPAAYKAQRNKRTIPLAYKLAPRGRVVAAKGYKIGKMTCAGKNCVDRLIAIPSDQAFKGYLGIDTDGEDNWCVCPGYPDDCQIVGLTCSGSCKCAVVYAPDDTDDIAGYETSSGR
ncbi:MAG: hypothetical protein HKN87_10200 [Saprospiraceae bacterium]|nr:hypothetical protein [Saprospiraceae bacterium]